MRRSICNKLITLKYIIFVLMFFFGYLLVNEIVKFANNELKSFDSIIGPIIIEVLYILAIFLISKLRTVEFDDEYLYITYKKIEQKIPLENVFYIKLTMIEVNNFNFWKMKYLDNEKNNCSVRFLPNRNFYDFKELIKVKNKNVKIRNWSHSFDFDQ